MKKIVICSFYFCCLIIFSFLLVLLSCAPKQKQSFVIGPPPQRTIIVPANSVSSSDDANSVEYRDAIYPDPRWGCIENKAYPYRPKIWYIKQGSKIALVGPAQEHLPSEFLAGEIREFHFPFGTHVLHIERWYKFGGIWARVGKVDEAKLKIKQFVEWTSEEQWGWKIVINQKNIVVYNKGDY